MTIFPRSPSSLRARLPSFALVSSRAPRVEPFALAPTLTHDIAPSVSTVRASTPTRSATNASDDPRPIENRIDDDAPLGGTDRYFSIHTGTKNDRMDATRVGASRPRRVRDEDDRARRRPRAIDRHRHRDPSSSRSIDRSIDPSSSSESKSCSTNNPNDGRTDRARPFARSFARGTHLHRQSQRPSSRQRVLVRSHRIRARRRRASSSRAAAVQTHASTVASPAGKMDTDATSRLSVSQWWVFNYSLVV